MREDNTGVVIWGVISIGEENYNHEIQGRQGIERKL